ncbi:hypothetical protein BV25DRAFT_1838313 [Artomyces pyxidatus]|uniref:Uncharacterized protein n=1 Tax=Artomyces pyxidatus TaxID=48021 RepID=A0ACB8T2U7_9AGAM|nr:hypothetical protein BV25DRAFT_1838313 [Artomyces pyxidatus]
MSNSKIQIRLVETFTDNETQKAMDVWRKAYKDDPFVRAVTGGDPELYEKFIHSVLLATSRGGKVYFASYADVEVAGVSAWYPPGRIFGDTPEQSKGGFDELFEGADPELKKWWLDYIPKFDAQTTAALGEGVKLASWHLMFIGVLPDIQHRGIGTALVNHVKQIADAEGKVLCVETGTEVDVKFYEYCGFFIKGPVVEYENPTQNFSMWVLSTEKD